jgi:hypothetical protein
MISHGRQHPQVTPFLSVKWGDTMRLCYSYSRVRVGTTYLEGCQNG